MEQSLKSRSKRKSHHAPPAAAPPKKRKLAHTAKRVATKPSRPMPNKVSPYFLKKNISKAKKSVKKKVKKRKPKRPAKREPSPTSSNYFITKQEDNKVLSRLYRPTKEECEYVTLSLAKLHPDAMSKNWYLTDSCRASDCVTDAIISVMLSQNTTDVTARAAFQSLKESFPNWDDVASCEDIAQIERAIQFAGLGKKRAVFIQEMLRTVKKERGTASLDYIRAIESNDYIKNELLRFKGLGKKTVSCVLLFALQRSEFPVDTHVLRISKKMGWVSQSETREGAYDHLNSQVPSKLKMNLHCLIQHHGKVCHQCAATVKSPKDGSKIVCPLADISRWAGSIPSVKDAKVILAAEKKDSIKSETIKQDIRIKEE